MDLDDIEIKLINTQFEIKLKEMEAKLPPKLGEVNNNAVYDEIKDKEFCYKFLYCWLNNPDNQTNEDVKAVYNIIIDAYDITNFEKQNTNSIVLNNNITFDVGFIINIKPLQVITERGGSAIPTQKRRPNKAKKSNRTIKDRVKTR